MREFLDGILAFIGATSLTDEEFDLITLDVQEYSPAVYNELRMILEMREGITDQVTRLRGYFIAKGNDMDTEGNPNTPKGNIFLGSKL